MLFGLLAGAAAFAALHYLKLPRYERCPAGRRKHARKNQAKARRMLRDPKNRGDRDSHRAAWRLMRLTRKSKPVKYRPPTPEEMARDEQLVQDLLAKWAFERSQEIAAGVTKMVYEDGDSMITEEPRGPMVRCRCGGGTTTPNS